jgi:NADH dehydrogenase [ubiquinone] 1 alpha subcomplex assembly factor 1
MTPGGRTSEPINLPFRKGLTKAYLRNVKRFGTLLVAVVVAVIPTFTNSARAGTTRLFDFRPKDTPWVVINDGVMGGVSSGRFAVKSGVATFRGTLRLDNNGGFASIRSAAEVGTLPRGADSFELRVKGDGKAYQFTVDTEVGWYWFKMIPAKGKWSTITIPFTDLEPVTRFGEPTMRDRFTGAQRVSRFGVLIANKRNEEFSISLDWIGATDSGG